MNAFTNPVDVLKHFADENLHNHFAALDARYYHRELNSVELEKKAYEEHQEIYRKELDIKIKELLTDQPGVKDELEQVKNIYLAKLTLEAAHE